MPDRTYRIRGREVRIAASERDARLFLDGEEIQVVHHDGRAPFGTAYLPNVHFESLDAMARALIQHRFPGGER